MSAAEKIQADSSAAAGPGTAMDVGQAVAQLRMLVCGLGLAVLALSLVFDVFVLKKNRELQGQAGNRNRQVSQIAGMQERWVPALNDLARYSAEKTDLATIFKKHGLELKLPASQDAQSPPLEP